MARLGDDCEGEEAEVRGQFSSRQKLQEAWGGRSPWPDPLLLSPVGSALGGFSGVEPLEPGHGFKSRFLHH